MVSGFKAARMGSESGKDSTMTATWANGETTKFGATVCINGLMAINTKESGLHL